MRGTENILHESGLGESIAGQIILRGEALPKGDHS